MKSLNYQSCSRRKNLIQGFTAYLLMLACLLSSLDSLAQQPIVGSPQKAKEFKGDLRLLPKVKPWKKNDPIKEMPQLILPEDTSRKQVSPPKPTETKKPERDGALSNSISGLALASLQFSTPSPNFPGIGATGFTPPDTNGDVGPNHYIQMVNASLAIWDKQGNQLLAPTNINQIWVNAGDTGVCANQNRGDPYVVYDHLADRWLISQFARNTDGTALRFMCIAVSRTADPVAGGWNLYTFDLEFSDDYPKIGVWPDGYYMVSQRGYNGNPVDVTVFDRANMLTGAAATFQTFQVAGPPTIIMLPSDLDGAAPPLGTPNFYVRPVDGDAFGGADRLEIREFHVDWATPANSTLSAPVNLAPAAFSSEICNGINLFNFCIAQPGVGSPRLEALSVWPMGPLQYRNFGGYETLVFNHTVDVDNALSRTGVRWYELRRNNGGPWVIHQQGTYAPDEGNAGLTDDPDRWMGSIAMDRNGNIALGYSVSATNVSPGIRYVGRQDGDPLGLMTTGEITLQSGSGFQSTTISGDTTASRWGDYSAMRVDPTDECTFWYTQEYTANGNDGSGNPQGGSWRTRIAAFHFDDCGPDLSITKTDSSDPVAVDSDLTYTLTVTNNGPTTASGVIVTDNLPAANISFVSVATTQGTCSGTGPITCTLGILPSGANVTITIVVHVNNAGNLTNQANVVLNENDPNTANNSVTETTAAKFLCFGTEATIVGTLGPDAILGTTGNDIIVTRTGDDSINSLSGDDFICTGDGNDSINADIGNDKIDSGKDMDSINAGSGNDQVLSGDDTDSINGGSGDDIIGSGNGIDVVNGGPGVDVCTNAEIKSGCP